MIAPTIHLNGTSREHLLTIHFDALNAARDLVRALRGVAPNGRDFYPQGPHAIVEATREHQLRVAAAQDVASQIEIIIEAINNQEK